MGWVQRSECSEYSVTSAAGTVREPFWFRRFASNAAFCRLPRSCEGRCEGMLRPFLGSVKAATCGVALSLFVHVVHPAERSGDLKPEGIKLLAGFCHPQRLFANVDNASRRKGSCVVAG